MTYNGLESCILNSNSYEDESIASKGDGFPTDSPDEDTSSCCSSNNPSGSSFSQWTTMKRDEHGLDEWEYSDSPTRRFIAKEKPSYAVQFSDMEVMKENFAKLLLGEDMTGGRDGVSAALALSNAITNLAGTFIPLGEDLYKILNRVPSSAAGMLKSLSLKSENHALDAINRLEAAIHAWKEKIEEHDSGKSPARTSWSFKDPILEFDKMELLINRAEDLSREIQIRYPNLPQKFLDVMKIQYGKDVAHAILEAYSRVLGNLAFSILTRIGDICQEDVLSDPDSPLSLPGMIIPGILGSSTTLINKVNSIEGKLSSLQAEETSILSDEAYTRSVTATPSRISGCCLGKEAYFMSPTASP